MEKKSFILHKDSLEILNELTDEQAGKLFKAIYYYQNEIYNDLDIVTKMTFLPFKNQFIRDKTKYLEKSIINSENGKLGGRKNKAKQSEKSESLYLEANVSETSEMEKNKANQADSDSDSDSDSGSENDNEKNKEKIKEIIFFNFRKKEFDNLPREVYEKLTDKYKIYEPIIYYSVKFPISQHDFVEHLVNSINDVDWILNLQHRFGNTKDYKKAMIDCVQALKTNYKYMEFNSTFDFRKYFANWFNMYLGKY